VGLAAEAQWAASVLLVGIALGAQITLGNNGLVLQIVQVSTPTALSVPGAFPGLIDPASAAEAVAGTALLQLLLLGNSNKSLEERVIVDKMRRISRSHLCLLYSYRND
jgi:hypothetical protein